MTSLSRLGAAQMAGAKYLSKSLKKMNQIEKKQAELEAKLIEGQKDLVKGTADAMISGADAQARSTKDQAIGQIATGSAGVALTSGSIGGSIYGASVHSTDEADLNQQMADHLNKPVEALHRQGRSEPSSNPDASEATPSQEDHQARLKELFGKHTENPNVLSEKANKAGFLKGKKLSEEHIEKAQNVTDPKFREEMATKYSDRAKAIRSKVEDKRKTVGEFVGHFNNLNQAAAALLNGGFSAKSANSQQEQGQQRAIETQFQGAEQSRKAAADAAHNQTQSDMQLIKDQVEAMRRIASPN
jgi:hypothetical protein